MGTIRHEVLDYVKKTEPNHLIIFAAKDNLDDSPEELQCRVSHYHLLSIGMAKHTGYYSYNFTNGGSHYFCLSPTKIDKPQALRFMQSNDILTLDNVKRLFKQK